VIRLVRTAEAISTMLAGMKIETRRYTPYKTLLRLIMATPLLGEETTRSGQRGATG